MTTPQPVRTLGITVRPNPRTKPQEQAAEQHAIVLGIRLLACVLALWAVFGVFVAVVHPHPASTPHPDVVQVHPAPTPLPTPTPVSTPAAADPAPCDTDTSCAHWAAVQGMAPDPTIRHLGNGDDVWDCGSPEWTPAEHMRGVVACVLADGQVPA